VVRNYLNFFPKSIAAKDYWKVQGCQIFLVQNTQTGKNIPNYHEQYQMSIKYNKRP
jgi:hypothetical protein